MNELQCLIDLLSNEDDIYIQTHNFPDHDAIASAFGLQFLLSTFNISSKIIYDGEIQRDSLKNMIESLNIKIEKHTSYNITNKSRVIIIDGCKGNENVSDLPGTEIAVIDHHKVQCSEEVKYIDIRSDYGSCSTIIYKYFEENSIKIPKDVATALLIGINIDTCLLTRMTSDEDIRAYTPLYLNARRDVVNSALRNNIRSVDLNCYKYIIENLDLRNGVAYCCLKDGCPQNLLGTLGDFVLSIEEVDFVILCAKNEKRINFSIRSEKKYWDASKIIQKVLFGIGSGGGHADMAGGSMKLSLFDEKSIYNKFLDELNSSLPIVEAI